jgi:hypothetical protein
MTLFPFRFLAPLALLPVLAACSPSAIPAGYSYHRDTYKSPPYPKAEPVGYAFTVPANQRAVDAWVEVAADLVSRLESGYVFTGRDIAVIPTLESHAMNKSLDFALNKAFSEKGYTLKSYNPDLPAIVTAIHEPAKENRAGELESPADFAARHGFKPEDIEQVVIRLDVREGNALVHQMRAVYNVPAFADEPEYTFEPEFQTKSVAGEAPYRAEPELHPKPSRPASPVVLTPTGGEKTAGGASEDTSLERDELDAPEPADEENKPLDLQGFNQ